MADDALVVTHHGTTTHMDALCHMWSGDELYNGHPAARVRSYGATRCGIEQAGGVVARGVLFDVPRHLGLRPPARRLPHPGRRCWRRSARGPRRATWRSIRTGWPLVWKRSPEEYWSGQPGLSAGGGPLAGRARRGRGRRDNAAIGGLNGRQLADEALEDDLHLILLWRHGIHLMEMLWLEDLAAAPLPHGLRFRRGPAHDRGRHGEPDQPARRSSDLVAGPATAAA